MAEPAREGNVYKIDLQDRKPPHYWIVLNDPQIVDGSFLLVSFTDREHNLGIADVWPTGYPLTPKVKLAKPSIIACTYACIQQQSWLDSYASEYLGTCSSDSLKRARCNLSWYQRFVDPKVKRYASFYAGEWFGSCGQTPPHSA